MAAIFMTNITLISNSKSFSNVPSLTLAKPSMAFFASNHSNGRISIGRKNMLTTKTRNDVIARSTAEEDAKKFLDDAREKTIEAANSLVDKVQDDANTISKNIESAADKAKDDASDAKKETKDATSSLADKAKEGIEILTKKTDEVVASTTKDFKDAEKRAENIKEAVAGEN